MMNNWDVLYKEGKHQVNWPWSDLVSLVKRNTSIGKTPLQVLELGCGTGANIPFFASELDVNYTGVDFSPEPLLLSVEKCAALAFPADLRVMDIINHLPSGPFNLIVDRATSIHNSFQDMQRILNNVFESLEPGGIFIGCDWFSDYCSDTDYLKEVGKTFFLSEEGIRELFKNFKITHLELKTISKVIPESSLKVSVWNIVARKEEK